MNLLVDGFTKLLSFRGCASFDEVEGCKAYKLMRKSKPSRFIKVQIVDGYKSIKQDS